LTLHFSPEHSVGASRAVGLKECEMKANEETKTYAWQFKDGKVNCYKDSADTCNVTKLWEVEQVSNIHDAVLAEATKKINAILSRVESGHRDSGRVLRFIQFNNRHLLVWAACGNVGPFDDDTALKLALRLKSQ
jgi:hypothetical protein